ncbi:MAG: protein kinase [Legionellaceae bacterium]|nr:protein kinase [Legionellaceae bacterium]
MPKSLLIVVSDGFGGYGDFLFALKLSEQLKRYNEQIGAEVPPVYIVTQDSGKKTIETLHGHTEFGVEILTPNDLEKKIKTNNLDVGQVIEAPVMRFELIAKVSSALKGLSAPVPHIIITEYNHGDPGKELLNRRRYRDIGSTDLSSLRYMGAVNSGFMADLDDNHKDGIFFQGILLSEGLINPQDHNTQVAQLEDKIRTPIFEKKSAEEYQDDTDLSFQYSHDSYHTDRNDTPAKHYLMVHREFTKEKTNKQDVIMIGKNRDKKREALGEMIPLLMNDGYARISFYNADTGEEEILHHHGEGKSYRVIYTSGLTHQSMMALTALSGPLTGATGDQSLSEAVSANKLMLYECLKHKQDLIESYDAALKKMSDDSHLVIETLQLLRKATTTDEYERLGELLRNPDIQNKIKHANQSVIKDHNLASNVVNFEQVLCENIVRYSRQANGIHPQILELLENNRGIIDINYQYNGRSLLQTLTEKAPIDIIFKQLLDKKSYELAGDIIQATKNHEDKLALGNILNSEVITVHTIFDRNAIGAPQVIKTQSGRTYLDLYREACPLPDTTTAEATFMTTLFQLNKYHPKPGSKREIMFESFRELTKTFSSLSSYDEKALIGLLLLNKKNIAAEYKYISPNNWLFGSKFHKILGKALKGLDVNLGTLTLEQEQGYYHALHETINKQPNFLGNEYILQSLAKQAHVELPPISKLPAVTVQRILSNPKSTKDSSILHTDTGFYHVNPKPIEQSGSGSVYAGIYYAQEDDSINVSQPLALKQVQVEQASMLDKEYKLCKQVHPQEGQFKRFNQGRSAYLVMPLSPGIRLDKYLSTHPELAREDRLKITKNVLTHLHDIHKKGITHNKLNLKNILFDPVKQEIHMIDFSHAEEHGTHIHSIAIDSSGFALEMPPEYLIGANSTALLDVFSIMPICAEICGVNKTDLVVKRMENAFQNFEDEILKNDIRSVFNLTQNLEEVLPKLYQHRTNPNLHKFIQAYVKIPYNFELYKDRLDQELIDLFNQMQNSEPSQRPNLQDCIGTFNGLIGPAKNPTQEFKSMINHMRENDTNSAEEPLVPPSSSGFHR